MSPRSLVPLPFLAALACAHPRAGEGGAPPAPTGAELALQCARSTVQASGFQVRLPDPREPYLLIADFGGISPTSDHIIVRVVPASSPEEPARVIANAEGPRRGMASNEATETARRVETRCGRIDPPR